MERSAVILAGGASQRFGIDKALVELAGKPLILHVLERIEECVDETIVCIRSSAQISLYSQMLSGRSKIAVDPESFPSCPLTGALTGLMNAHGKCSILLPCDTPFISRRLVDLLFDIANGVDAVIPRWPNGYIEPLQAVYETKSALMAAEDALKKGEYRMQSMLSLLKRVRYLSTLVIEEIDYKLLTFFNINTQLDLKKAEALIKRGMRDRLKSQRFG
ncbi:MAG: molybdenum cofactor guanylyltransferase [Candidatus Bathyarchaeia archaeon]